MRLHITIPTYGLRKREITALRRAITTVNRALAREGLEARSPATLSYGTRSPKVRTVRPPRQS